MDKKIDIDEMLRTEWRELGFYYETDDSGKEWKIFGNKKSIRNFATTIQLYCNSPENAAISEHIHLGPYSYLKIMTWDKALITTDFIAGTIEDLKKLRGLIIDKLKTTEIGDTFTIDKEFGDQNEAQIVITVMPDAFDPVSMDKQLRLP